LLIVIIVSYLNIDGYPMIKESMRKILMHFIL